MASRLEVIATSNKKLLGTQGIATRSKVLCRSFPQVNPATSV